MITLGRIFDIPQSLALILGLFLIFGGAFVFVGAYMAKGENKLLAPGALVTVALGFAIEATLITGKVYFIW